MNQDLGIKIAWDTLTDAMKDPDYAWSWHCNLAMPILDATGCSHELANQAAAYLMQHLWGCDITTHPHYEYGKSGAQAYTELRIAAERAEDEARGQVQ
jgi:hypothetical protein